MSNLVPRLFLASQLLGLLYLGVGMRLGGICVGLGCTCVTLL